MTRRILVLSPSTDMYGSDRALLTGLPALTQRADVIVAVPVEGPLIAELERQGIGVIVTPDFAIRRRVLSPVGLVLWVGRVLQTLRILRRETRLGVDLIYVNTTAVLFFPLLRLLGRRPILLHVHERARGGVWEQRIINFTARFATKVIANSRFTAGHLGPVKDRTEIVYNGVDVPDRIPCATRSAADVFTIVCVGRLHPKKGQTLLLEAVRSAVADGADWRIRFHGDALPEHESIEAELRAIAAAETLSGRVEFAGYSHDTDSLYADADVSVVPSVDPEEFSLVAAESQARGLATIVTGPGGSTEVIADGETGFVVDPDAGQLRDRLETLADDRALAARFGAAGHRRMQQRFQGKNMIDRLGAVLDDLMTS
jgi:glycosyltransferase involved in cell wall biosynthesis